MESSAAPYVARPRNSRERRHSHVPVIVFAILAICGALAPQVMLAAETPVETQRNSVVVFMVIILLFGSMVAGLIFASPLRRRLIRTSGGSNGAGEAAVTRHAWPGPGRRAADQDVARSVSQPAQPTYVHEGHAMETRTVNVGPSARYAQGLPTQPGYAPLQPTYAPPAQPTHAAPTTPTYPATQPVYGQQAQPWQPAQPMAAQSTQPPYAQPPYAQPTYGQPTHAQPTQPAYPSPMQPTYPPVVPSPQLNAAPTPWPTPTNPTQPTPPAPQPRVTPWSTSNTQADPNWDRTGRDRSS